MQNWEYISVVINSYGEKKIEMINEYGKEGWELISIQDSCFYFKRPIEPAE
jgi:hypothetical protein